MQYRNLGSTDLLVSLISFGAGPVSLLMINPAARDLQRQTVARALDVGINWFDTAPGYGQGESERSLGLALRDLKAADRVHVATKVRLDETGLSNIGAAVRASFAGSLARLGIDRVTCLQLHNSITPARGDLPTSITPHDVLGPAGVLHAFEKLRRAGLVQCLGLTGLGEPAALREVLASRAFVSVQVPYNVLNPSAGRGSRGDPADDDHAGLLAVCREVQAGALAIRVFAGGALVGRAPSDHTRKTKFFPLDLYTRDARRAQALAQKLPEELTLPEFALRFAISHSSVTSALMGFMHPTEIDAAAAYAARGPLEDSLLDQF
jgi:aryl-alcohol dehydrogenase-like predicted oxidoreductase